jgi:hypothetical protein
MQGRQRRGRNGRGPNLGVSLFLAAVLVFVGLAGESAEAAAAADGSVHNRFSAINNMAMPGLSPADWPTVQFFGAPPGVRAAANVISNDLKYTVTFYDFSSPLAARAFYTAPPGAMLSFLRGAMGYVSLNGPIAVRGRTRGVDLRSCVGEGAGMDLFPNGQCSDGSLSFSIGVGTITQVGPVVMMVGYVRNNARTMTASPAELRHDVKVAVSGLQLLTSIGIGTR